jgi:hypothetical protein
MTINLILMQHFFFSEILLSDYSFFMRLQSEKETLTESIIIIIIWTS